VTYDVAFNVFLRIAVFMKSFFADFRRIVDLLLRVLLVLTFDQFLVMSEKFLEKNIAKFVKTLFQWEHQQQLNVLNAECQRQRTILPNCIAEFQNAELYLLGSEKCYLETEDPQWCRKGSSFLFSFISVPTSW